MELIKFEYPRTRNKVWDSHIDEGFANRKSLFAPLFNDACSVQVPVVYKEDAEIISNLGLNNCFINEIIEDGKYLMQPTVKARVKKVSWLQEHLNRASLDAQVQNTTSGELWITINPVIMALASDSNYTSWTSCYSPGGCYYDSCLQWCSSYSGMMALILNSDHTKIIGRRWIVFPTKRDGSLAELVLFQKNYGTFPINYQRSLSEFLIEAVFKTDKHSWKNVSAYDASARVYADQDNGGNGYRSYQTNSGHGWYMDPAKFAWASDEDVIKQGSKYYFNNYCPTGDVFCCTECNEEYPRDTMQRTWSGDYVCESCREDDYTWSSWNDTYVRNDDIFTTYDGEKVHQDTDMFRLMVIGESPTETAERVFGEESPEANIKDFVRNQPCSFVVNGEEYIFARDVNCAASSSTQYAEYSRILEGMKDADEEE